MPKAFPGTRPTGATTASTSFSSLARSELDENLRREMYFEMQQIVSDEGGIIIPMFAAYVGAYSDALVKPDQVASNWRNDGHRIGERWWFA